MAYAGSKPYFISFTLPDGSRMRERVENFQDEKRILQDYREEYGYPVTLRGRTYARSASRKPKKNPCGKYLTLRNMALVGIERLPGGSVKVSGRRMAAGRNPAVGAHHKKGNREWWLVKVAANTWALRRRIFNKSYGAWMEQSDRLFTSYQEANEAGRDWASG
jgi:hypothetical protein